MCPHQHPIYHHLQQLKWNCTIWNKHFQNTHCQSQSHTDTLSLSLTNKISSQFIKIFSFIKSLYPSIAKHPYHNIANVHFLPWTKFTYSSHNCSCLTHKHKHLNFFVKHNVNFLLNEFFPLFYCALVQHIHTDIPIKTP